MSSGPLLLVFGDSQCFHGPERGEPADEPRLWPNVAATALGGHAELAAGIGWTARHAWHALTHDPRVWALLPHVDALVFGVGGMDTLPSVHPGRPAAERATRAWAGRAGVALLDLPALVGEHVLGGHGNPDGMHWGWDGHAAVGRACAEVLRPMLAARRS